MADDEANGTNRASGLASCSEDVRRQVLSEAVKLRGQGRVGAATLQEVLDGLSSVKGCSVPRSASRSLRPIS